MNADSKVCTKCNVEKKFSEFRSSKLGKYGLRSHCKVCSREYRRNHPENKDVVSLRNKRIYASSKDKFKEINKSYYELNKEKLKHKAKERYLIKKAEIRDKQKLYYTTNKGFVKHSEKRVKRNLLTSNATIDKSKLEVIQDFYRNTPRGYHVDHIIPLNHNLVCGLNVPWNLQYLTKKENLKKSNNFDGTYDNESWRLLDKECHQYVRRLETKTEDLIAGMPFDLKASEFELQNEKMSPEIKRFIERYEWLGTVGWNVKWCFTARHKGRLAGVVLMSDPVAPSIFSKSAGRLIEALVQRGACASWAPRNLNSRLLMYSCRWMVDNTDRRVFLGYSDPEAKEIGTIYQACNFHYLGSEFGNTILYVLESGKRVGARYFTRTSSMKRWAKELGIRWEESWSKPNGYQDVKALPSEVKQKLNEHAAAQKAKCYQITRSSKGKYALVLTQKKEGQLRVSLTRLIDAKPYPKRSNT